ncbi:hypothetical protein NCLIV_062480 [Neospora caninum Liverpool]|nr:hypothetical protein NCLIV_062480 [Neospora caninum Liverpool]CBZ55822.1 hypothetical protein NCLIV_062480 [Neospora caninum Liverpool]|eukprot:XP_003885848.1 hypothetical protein NCLIV_062480 [Neospora caninum Liverpool]
MAPRQESGDTAAAVRETASNRGRGRGSSTANTVATLSVPGDRTKYASAHDDKQKAFQSHGLPLGQAAEDSSVSTKADANGGYTDSQIPATQSSTDDQGERLGNGCAVLGSKYPGFYEDDDDDTSMFIPSPGAAFLASRGPEIARGRGLLNPEMRFSLDNSPPIVLQKPRAKEQPKSRLKSLFNFSMKGTTDKRGNEPTRLGTEGNGDPHRAGSQSVGFRHFGTDDDAEDGYFGSFSRGLPRDRDALHTGLSMQSCISLSDDECNTSETKRSHRSVGRDHAQHSTTHGDTRSAHGSSKDHSKDPVSSTRSSAHGEQTERGGRPSKPRRKTDAHGRKEEGKQDADSEGECPCCCCCCCCCCCGSDAEEGRETIQVNRRDGSTYRRARRPSRRYASRR